MAEQPSESVPTDPAESAREKLSVASLDRIFGTVFPDATAAERAFEADGGPETHQSWLFEQVPPHHVE